MATFQEFVNLGKEIGLEGQELLDFAKEREAAERDERAEARALEKAKLEAQEKASEDAKEIELARIAAEKETSQNEMELAKARFQSRAEHEEVNPHDVSISEFKRMMSSEKPKLPAFDVRRDNIDAYLARFERYAKMQKWPEGEWSSSLGALLTGRALDTYCRLSPKDANCYKTLKLALLKAFECTEDGFRYRFRNCRLESAETYPQFGARIEHMFTRWVELSSAFMTYDGLKDLMLREQLMISSSRELATFVKERQPSNFEGMLKLAEAYREAHPRPVRKQGQLSNVQCSIPSQEVKVATPVQQAEQRDQNKDRTSLRQIRCHRCKLMGHIARECTQKTRYRYQEEASCLCTTNTAIEDETVEQPGSKDIPVMSAYVSRSSRMPVTEGVVSGKTATVLRDSGCSGVVVGKSLVPEGAWTKETQQCVLLDGTVREVPIAELNVDTPYYIGTVRAMVMDNPLYDLVIGNIPGARGPADPSKDWKYSNVDEVGAVETRGQKVRKSKPFTPLSTPDCPASDALPDEIAQAQDKDTSLSKIRTMVKEGKEKDTPKGNMKFVMERKLLYRVFTSKPDEKQVRQLVVPTKYRNDVMKVGHETLFAGHLGSRKSSDRIMSSFYWPGIQADVRRYCRSCDICQRTTSKGRTMKVPLGQMPLIEVPFQRIAVDIVGPIHPITEKGNRYILTIVDYATRYPEAVALPGIEAERVAEALVEVFSRVGVPAEILTDRGTQFTSGVMAEVSRLLSMKQLVTTPYHPQCNGLVERFNGTLKEMLKKMCSEKPKTWDRYLSAVLFAYREAPQESLGFSPFELLYGRTVRGPVTILKELWTKEMPDTEVRTTYQYVLELRNRLEETCKLAREALSKNAQRYKKNFDRKTRNRSFMKGDKVLVLLPTDRNKLLMQWKGPYHVLDKIGLSDYRLQLPKQTKIFHANLLRQYLEREKEVKNTSETKETCFAAVGVVNIEDGDDGDEMGKLDITLPSLTESETYKDVKVNKDLGQDQIGQVQDIMKSFAEVLTDLPGKTDLIEHKIKLLDKKPIRQRMYPVPYAMRETIIDEVNTMLKLDVIEKSQSPYSSPIVIVKKKDGTNRFCVDYRRLNNITEFDAEPSPSTDELYAEIGRGKYTCYSKIDMTKGYWQIPLSDDAKLTTAFQTPLGQFHWKTMPFGLVNSAATFTRMMRILLHNADPGVMNYIDDILVCSRTWKEHLTLLRDVFDRMRKANLTAKPSKCLIGFSELEFLGHNVGQGKLAPEQGKIDKMLSIVTPKTKKEVRALLGLVSYYRKFIPNFAALTAPLTDLTKNGKPNQVVWDEPCERALNSVKQRLATSPILHLPDFSKEFIVRTDASNEGIGAVLLQDHDGKLFPVMYASKKLQPRERNYSTTEKECLAIVWAVEKFQRYLYGKEFILETDHEALTYINKAKMTNSKVMRWSLALQQYRFRIRAIKGKDNIGADLLSRCSP